MPLQVFKGCSCNDRDYILFRTREVLAAELANQQSRSIWNHSFLLMDRTEL